MCVHFQMLHAHASLCQSLHLAIAELAPPRGLKGNARTPKTLHGIHLLSLGSSGIIHSKLLVM